MARPREFDPKAALQSAINVFWEKGYCDASVNEVVKRSGVAKYGIYSAFGTKRELFPGGPFHSPHHSPHDYLSGAASNRPLTTAARRRVPPGAQRAQSPLGGLGGLK